MIAPAVRHALPSAALALCLSALALHARAAADADVERGVALIERAGDGQADAIDAALAHFTRLSAAEPQAPLLLAYQGAAQAMKATTTVMPWRKMAFAEDGLALLDKALVQLVPAHDTQLHRKVPASLETRFVAANTFLSLPSMFNRKERGTRLLEEVLNSPMFEAAPLAFRGTVWMRAAQAAQADKRAADATGFLKRVVAAGAPQASAAQAAVKAAS